MSYARSPRLVLSTTIGIRFRGSGPRENHSIVSTSPYVSDILPAPIDGPGCTTTWLRTNYFTRRSRLRRLRRRPPRPPLRRRLRRHPPTLPPRPRHLQLRPRPLDQPQARRPLPPRLQRPRPLRLLLPRPAALHPPPAARLQGR